MTKGERRPITIEKRPGSPLHSLGGDHVATDRPQRRRPTRSEYIDDSVSPFPRPRTEYQRTVPASARLPPAFDSYISFKRSYCLYDSDVIHLSDKLVATGRAENDGTWEE